MPKFAFEFDTVLRYRRYRRGLVRQLLAGILADLANEDARRAAIVRQRDATLDEIRAIGASGPMDVDAAAARRFHTGVLNAEVAAVDHRRDIVRHQLETCRSALVEADRDVRLLERLRETRLADFRQVAERREQIELEEAWRATRPPIESTHGRRRR